MADRRFVQYILIILLLTSSCNRTEVTLGGRIPLVQYNEEVLYLDNISEYLTPKCTPEDSMQIISNAIEEWLGNIKTVTIAQKNITSLDKIEAEVARYRQQLILHEYQEELINSRLSLEVSEYAISSYYEINKAFFKAEIPYMQGLTIRVPSNASDIAELKGWVQKNSEETIEKIEKYSIKNAISYNYFPSEWKAIEEVFAQSGVISKEAIGSITKEGMYTFSDSTTTTFVKVENYCAIGMSLPYDYARAQIREFILNKRAAEYILSLRTELSTDAKNDNGFKYFDGVGKRVEEFENKKK